MRDLAVLVLHLLTTFARLAGPAGARAASGPIIVSPEVGGLHHRYDREAA